jgi:hypothetical protein
VGQAERQGEARFSWPTASLADLPSPQVREAGMQGVGCGHHTAKLVPPNPPSLTKGVRVVERVAGCTPSLHRRGTPLPTTGRSRRDKGYQQTKRNLQKNGSLFSLVGKWWTVTDICCFSKCAHPCLAVPWLYEDDQYELAMAMENMSNRFASPSKLKIWSGIASLWKVWSVSV